MSISSKPIIVMAHGCFDVLHPGHIQHLQEARCMGDFLIVTVTADEFVNKGPGKPIFTAEQRCEQLAALSCVDFVTTNHADNAAEAIRIIRPDIFAKGRDYWNFDPPGLREEKAALAEIGGRLVHTRGQVFHSSELARIVLETA